MIEMRAPRVLLPVLFALLAAAAAGAAEPARVARIADAECAAPKVPVIVKGAQAAALAGCAQGGPAHVARAPRAPLHVPAYTPRFLPGFAVTVDRAHAVWSGFVAGVGQSLASGRNCFASSCGVMPQLQIDGGSFAPELPGPAAGADTATPRFATPLLPAGVPTVDGVAIAQTWTATPWSGAAPVELRVAAARNVYRWGAAAEPGIAASIPSARPQEAARGRSVSLELRAARFGIEAAEHRFRLDAVPAFAAAYEPGMLRRRDLRVTLQASGAQLSAALADTTALRAGAGTERVAWLAVRVPLE